MRLFMSCSVRPPTRRAARPPAVVRSRLSIQNWRRMDHLVAPNARRVAISSSLRPTRTKARPARLAQATEQHKTHGRHQDHRRQAVPRKTLLKGYRVVGYLGARVSLLHET